MKHSSVALQIPETWSREAPFGSLVDLLIERGRSRPDQVAYTFFDPSKAQPEALTYGELLDEVKGLAAWLAEQGAAGQRCLLLLPPGLGYIKAFFACLLAGAAAVPVYVPDPSRLNRSMPRLLQILRDAGAAFILTTSSLSPLLQPLALQRNLLSTLTSSEVIRRVVRMDAPVDRLRILSMPERGEARASHAWQDPRATHDTTAFLQYTSGSTSEPKGVVLTHGHLLSNLAAIRTAFGMTEEHQVVIWLPPYHDMGLIGGILAPLYTGCTTDLMSPLTFLQRPSHWLSAISRSDRRVLSGGPNFAFDLCVRRVSAEMRKKLDLSRWEVAFVGSEPVRHETLERFAREFASCGFSYGSFLPCYGLAEATLMVSGDKLANDPSHVLRVVPRSVEEGRPVRAEPDDPSARALVSCGPVVSEHRVVIVNPDTHAPVAAGHVGEIWVSGPSVAAGYWKRKEQTRATFEARLPGMDGTFLRTGDLGFMDEGRLFVTGRIKDVIIIGGRKHYPHDVEATVQAADPALRVGCGAAFAVDDGTGENLVVVQEVSSERAPSDLDGLMRRIREEVAEVHGVPPSTVVLIRERTIPKTSSGKIQRSATRALLDSRKLDVVARWSARAV